MNTDNLIRYIESHGEQVHGAAGGKIAVVSRWTRNNGHEYGETVKLIDATPRAVRDWLGY